MLIDMIDNDIEVPNDDFFAEIEDEDGNQDPMQIHSESNANPQEDEWLIE